MRRLVHILYVVHTYVNGENVTLDTVAAAVQEKKRCPVRPSTNSANAGHRIVWRIVPMQE